MYYPQICLISKGLHKLIYRICSHHDIDEILLKLALNTNQSINQTYYIEQNKSITLTILNPIPAALIPAKHAQCPAPPSFFSRLLAVCA